LLVKSAARANPTALEPNMFIAIALSTIAAIVAVYGIALWVDAPKH
jgi:hypothetical protein